MAEWFEELFDERYFDFYQGALRVEPAEQEAAFIDRALALPRGARLLDLGCGFGRHAVPLAGLGYLVTGVDLSGVMLAVAREAAQASGLEVDLQRRDLRDLSGLGPFDACVCLYTVFGYFDDAENARVLRSLRDVLRDGARLLLDLDNPLALLRHWPGTRWRETASGVTREISLYDPMTACLTGKRTLFRKDGGRVELPTSVVRTYPPHEVGALLRQAGFEVDQVYGALDDRPFDWARSPKQVWVATRV